MLAPRGRASRLGRRVFQVLLCVAAGCEDGRFVVPSVPNLATDLNGVKLADVCFYGQEEHHVFVIGDWGGLEPEMDGEKVEGNPTPANDTVEGHGNERQWMHGVDDNAQMRVAEMMRARAPVSRPDFIINVGDSFYWGGLDQKCGTPCTEPVESSQWVNVFEKVYTGDGIDGRQWLGVLGNHDYGGWQFGSAWDQLIAYTWRKDLPGSKDRWVMPAQYYHSQVYYPFTDELGNEALFTVEYFFVDSNRFDAHEGGYDSSHNICDPSHNGPNATCGEQGPLDVEDCPKWFANLWREQMRWLEEKLQQSTAEWKIVVTHFPPGHGREDWKRLADAYGIDLILSGHEHNQQLWYNHTSNFLAPTAWVVSGGGGGISSSGMPDAHGNDDQYGFVDLTLTRDEITVEMISHGGFTRRIAKIHKGGEGDFLPNLTAWKVNAAAEEAEKAKAATRSAKQDHQSKAGHKEHVDIAKDAANGHRDIAKNAAEEHLEIVKGAAKGHLEKAHDTAKSLHKDLQSAVQKPVDTVNGHVKNAQDAVTGHVDNAKNAAKDLHNTVAGHAEGHLESAKDVVKDLRTKTVSHVDTAKDAVSDAVQDAADTLHNVTSSHADTAKEAVQDLNEKSKGHLETVVDAATDAVHHVHSTAKGHFETVKDAAQDVHDAAKHHIGHAAQAVANGRSRVLPDGISSADNESASLDADGSRNASQLAAALHAAAIRFINDTAYTAAQKSGCSASCELPGGKAVSCKALITWLANSWYSKTENGTQKPDRPCKAAFIEVLRQYRSCFGCALADAGCSDSGATAGNSTRLLLSA